MNDKELRQLMRFRLLRECGMITKYNFVEYMIDIFK